MMSIADNNSNRKQYVILGVLAVVAVIFSVLIAIRLFSTTKEAEVFEIAESVPQPGGSACYESIEVKARPVSIDIEKSTNGKDADNSPGPSIKVGNKVTWRYEVTNTGDTALEDISIKDDKEGDIVCDDIPDLLEPGESFSCTLESTALKGRYANEAEVTALSAEDGSQVSDSDPSHYEGTEEEKENHDPVCNEIRATPERGEADLKVRFDVDADDEDGDKIEEYQYHFGDGSYSESGDDTAYHTYTKSGKFKASVVVIDGEGNESGEDECEVEVKVTEPSHFECVDSACVEVDGEGDSTCSSDLDCTAPSKGEPLSHLECSNEACVEVSGPGPNLCTVDLDCAQEPVSQIPVTGSDKTAIIIMVSSLVLVGLGAGIFLK